MALLEIRNLSVEFPTRRQVFRAVDRASLSVEPGEIHGLVGESGAGKSTIGAAIMGLLERPGHIVEGDIHFHGAQISGLDRAAMQALRGKKFSMIFQDPLTSLNPLFTVGEQLVETILAHLDLSTSEAEQRAIELIERVGIADARIRAGQYPHQFSGGMRQRIVIALALCSEPDVIIADEPTTALDVAVQAQILELIRALTQERQVGVILITHDIGVISEITDKVSVMYRGAVVESGATRDVLGRPSHGYTRSLIAAVPRPERKLHRFPDVGFGGRKSVFAIEALAGNWPRYEVEAGQALISIENAHKRFLQKPSILPRNRRYFTAVDRVSLDIQAGEVFGIVGESGSGKSTLARMISGLYKMDGGAVRFLGDVVSDPAQKENIRAFRQNIQMIFQDPYSSLNPRMRVDAIIAEPIHHHGLLAGRAVSMRVEELLEQVGLGRAAAQKYPHEFSGGQRQRISIARALATEPRFLICDEPSSALDVSIQAQILNILKDLQEHLGLTMLFISHDLPVVRQMCNRVGVMQNGALVEVQETEALFSAPQSDYTKKLLELMPRLDKLQAVEV